MDEDDGPDPPSADAVAPGPGDGFERPEPFGRPEEPRVFDPARRIDRARLIRHGIGDMRISWIPSPDEGGLHLVTYSVLRGTLASLRAGAHDHELVDPTACGITEHEYVMTDQRGGSYYYLVVPVGGDNATFGYDSTGTERPAAGVCFESP